MQRHILRGTMGLLLAASCAVAQVPALTGSTPSSWKPSIESAGNGPVYVVPMAGQATSYAAASVTRMTATGYGGDCNLCCGQNFGCLWSTYCADKRRHRCGTQCNTCCAPAACRSKPTCRGFRPSPCRTTRKSLFRHNTSCDPGPGCCDGSAGAGDIGQPPAPVPPSQEPSVVPVPSAPNGPAVTGPNSRSARRHWVNDESK